MAGRRHSYCPRCGIDYADRRGYRCAAYGRSYPQHIWTWDCEAPDSGCDDDHGED